MDAFKERFKYFKSLDLSKIKNPDDKKSLNIYDSLLLRPPDPKTVFQQRNLNKIENKAIFDECGLAELDKWEIFDVVSKDGLVFIKNPFTSLGQRYWISKCLQDYTKKPYKLNIDAHETLNGEWWEACHSGQEQYDRKLQKLLRWSTLGYHHDWDTKVYSEKNRQDFPDELSKLCKLIAEVCDFPDFIPQASIVNFYPMGSIMGGHTDHSEENLEAPLISISFGQSAIFLIGGETKDVVPLALHLCSGDIVIMSGYSRLCYHGVPKILKTVDKPWNNNIKPSINDDENYLDWNVFDDFITNSRININVRQVLNKNNHYLQNSDK